MKKNPISSTAKVVPFLGVGLGLVLALSGCGSFKASTPDASVLLSPTPAPTPYANFGGPATVIIPIGAPPGQNGNVVASPTTTILSHVSANEMQPIQLQFSASVSVISQTLPPGAVFDESTHQFLWLSSVGQAGQYQLQLSAPDNRTLLLPLSISKISPAQLALGPTDGVQDGDVGYVFVHGAGSVDRCADSRNLADYWKDSPSIIGRGPGLTTLACYDGRDSAEFVAKSVALQILNAKCGRFNKCIVITHSMGGLVMEHMFTHVRAAVPSDREPALFDNAELFQKARERTLAVISLASAAGGSRVADVVEDPGNAAALQAAVGQISNWLGENDDSTKSVSVKRASDILAPFNADPGVPFFMVPGYTRKTVQEQDDAISGFLNSVIGNISINVYQGDQSLALLDTIVQPEARFDGLVDFRSACGIASDDAHAGPGYSASLPVQMQYCFNSPKKANHVLWFASNLNHYLITTTWASCHNSKNPCVISDPDSANQTLSLNSSYRYLSAVEAIRAKLDVNRFNNPEIQLTYK